MSDNNKSHILRAWRDPDYHDSLSDAERAALPDSPASVLELDDATLAFITGGDGASTCPNTPPHQHQDLSRDGLRENRLLHLSGDPR
ncbi:mersacidin/lichenicidin family type 2 lantibiotic [Myxococcus xanthus]|uniref:mersacidin/lichenicidin family type 2 lantibiotic n=1 Tax=Myxococcus xanthus TaxID=34 RepID=UPI0011631141|nr:mersacidin/lichenicidin family type 2 lantibiotic [Myxococcus xanthus]